MGEMITFDNPPLTETVIGVQFEEILELTPAHFGWYWREHLRRWSAPQVVGPLADVFEAFPRDARALQGGVVFNFGPEPTRMQFRNDNKCGMIQLQRSRFIRNWLKVEGGEPYPRWATLNDAFEEKFAAFATMLAEAGLARPRVNQWEVVYVNQIARGEGWDTPADWPRLLPSLCGPGSRTGSHPLSGFAGFWAFDIEPARGRLHVEVSHRIDAPRGNEVLHLQLTARGPADPGIDGNYRSGLELGHNVIVQSFVDLTHADAHKAWGIRS